jgi:hypothetical protein
MWSAVGGYSSMIKLLKNVSASGILINDTGVYIDSGENYLIPQTDYLLWASSNDYQSFVTSGDIIVNNGAIDLVVATDGIRFIEYSDRSKIQKDGVDVTQVATTLNFTGATVTVTNNGDGKATVNVGASIPPPCLREVTMVVYPFGPMNILSNLLFEPDPVNDTILFLKEEIL